MFFSLAWRNLWRNRKRTVITAASIVFAVLLAILLNSLKEGILVRLQENVVSFYTGAVQVHQSGYWDEKTLENTFEPSVDLIDKINNHEGVNKVIARLESFALAASGDYSKGCMVVGIDPVNEPAVTALDKKVIQGKYLEENSNGVLVGEGLAEYLRLGIGDTIVLIGQGYHGVSAAGKYPIDGLLKFASPELNKSLIYMTLPNAQHLYGAENRLTALVLSIDNINDAKLISSTLSNALNDKNYEVMSWPVLLPELDQLIEGERAENVIFLFVLYLLISFGIFGTVLMMTMERQYEFGVLVAIGMRKLKLSGIVILENIMISIMGAIAGTILSVPAVFYLYNYPIRVTGELAEAYENFGFEPTFYFSIAPEIFYSQTIIVFSIAFVLSIYPLVKINSLDPVSAMRS